MNERCTKCVNHYHSCCRVLTSSIHLILRFVNVIFKNSPRVEQILIARTYLRANSSDWECNCVQYDHRKEHLFGLFILLRWWQTCVCMYYSDFDLDKIRCLNWRRLCFYIAKALLNMVSIFQGSTNDANAILCEDEWQIFVNKDKKTILGEPTKEKACHLNCAEFTISHT